MGLQTLHPGAAPAEPPQGHERLKSPQPLGTEAAVWGGTLFLEHGSAGPCAELQEGKPLHLLGGQVSLLRQPGETVLVQSVMLRGSVPAPLSPGGQESAGANPDPRAQFAAVSPRRGWQDGGLAAGRAGGDGGSEGPVGPGCCRTAASRNARRGTPGHGQPSRAFQLL